MPEVEADTKRRRPWREYELTMTSGLAQVEAVSLWARVTQRPRERVALGRPRTRRAASARLGEVLAAARRLNGYQGASRIAAAIASIETALADVTSADHSSDRSIGAAMQAARRACMEVFVGLRALTTSAGSAIAGGANCDGGDCERPPTASYVGTGAWIALGATGGLVRPYARGAIRNVCIKHERELQPAVEAVTLVRRA